MRTTAFRLLAFLALSLPGCKPKPAAADGTAAAETPAAGADAPSNVSLPVVGSEVRRGDLVLTISTT